jgi:hypothetical protein
MFGFVTSVYGLASTFGAMRQFRISCGLAHTLPPWAKTHPILVTVVATGAIESVDIDVT